MRALLPGTVRRMKCTGGGMSGSILYIHGFNSAPSSKKACQLIAVMAQIGLGERLRVPALHHHPRQAMAQLEAAIAELESPLLVGSSLGGYYATHLAERYSARAVLINPAIRPYDDLKPYRGTQVNMYSGETFEVSEAHFDELRKLEVARITRPGRYLLLAETDDEVLDYRQAVAFYGGAWQFVQGGGDHSYQGFIAQIPVILRFAAAAVAGGAFAT